jgi:outer membrane protein TolC
MLLLLAAVNVSALTLEQCLEQAKSHNKDLLAAKEDIYMADALYYDVRGSLLPQLSLVGGYQLKTTWLPDSATPSKMNFIPYLSDTASGNDSTLAGILTTFANSMIPESPLKEGSLATQLKFDQILFSGGRLINGIKAVGRYRSIQGLRYNLLEQELITKTTDMFYQTLLAQKVVDIQTEALSIANRHLNRVELLNTEGQVSEFDLLRAKLEVAKLKPQLLQAQNQYELAMAAFRKQIGVTDRQTTLDGEFLLPTVISEDLQTAFDNAQKQRIELRLSAINTEINQIKFNAAKQNYLPNIMLSADYSLFTKADGYGIEAADFGSAFNVGVGFQIPLFTGFSNTSKRAYAQHELSQSQVQETNYAELIQLEVKQAHQSLQNALENYNVQLENIKLAERSMQLAQVRFENQVGIQLEVFDAQIMLASVKLSYYNSIFEVISANQKLKKAMGFTL